MTYDEILKYNLNRLEEAFPNSKNSIGVTKEELAKFKQCSVATIDRGIKDSDSSVIPDYIKGKGKNSRIYWPILNVAIWCTDQTVKMA